MSDQLIQLATVGGPVATVLAVFIVGFVRGWIVPGYIHRRVQQEKQDLLNAVLQSTDAARLALETSQVRERDDAARLRERS